MVWAAALVLRLSENAKVNNIFSQWKGENSKY